MCGSLRKPRSARSRGPRRRTRSTRTCSGPGTCRPCTTRRGTARPGWWPSGDVPPLRPPRLARRDWRRSLPPARGPAPRLPLRRPPSLRPRPAPQRGHGAIAAGLSPAEMRELARYYASLPSLPPPPAPRPAALAAIERGRRIAHRGIPEGRASPPARTATAPAPPAGTRPIPSSPARTPATCPAAPALPEGAPRRLGLRTADASGRRAADAGGDAGCGGVLRGVGGGGGGRGRLSHWLGDIFCIAASRSCTTIPNCIGAVKKGFCIPISGPQARLSWISKELSQVQALSGKDSSPSEAALPQRRAHIRHA